MGSRSEHRCSRCGYSAVVSGGTDAGMAILTETVVCAGCRSLRDRVTAAVEPGPVFAPVAPEPCPVCAAPPGRARAWRSGDPCPRCGEPLRPDGGGAHVLWD